MFTLLNGLLILACFADTTFRAENSREDFDSLANGSAYTYGGATGSTRRYFYDQSGGQYDEHFDVVGPVMLPHPSVHYATREPVSEQEQYIADFVMDACHEAEQSGVDFRQYDADRDSVIDFVYVIYQGHGTADSWDYTTIWPHEWDIESALAYGLTAQDSLYVDYDWDADTIISERLPRYSGLMLGKYACSPEVRYADKGRTGIGTMAHEFAHVLGLPDYYVGISVGSWSLMGTGCYLNNGNTPPNLSVYDRCYIGWETSSEGLDPYCTDTTYWHETRVRMGWDRYLPYGGDMTWRVLYDSTAWAMDEVNVGVERMKRLDGTITAAPEYRSPLPYGRKLLRRGQVWIQAGHSLYNMAAQRGASAPKATR